MREQINLNTDQLTTEKLAAMYREYTNDFLTVAKFAEYHGINEDVARRIIDEGRDAHEDLRRNRLKNGAIEIARIELNGHIYVAADTNGVAGTEYATWAMDDEGNTYWGHYFEDRDEAIEDLKYRAGIK